MCSRQCVGGWMCVLLASCGLMWLAGSVDSHEEYIALPWWPFTSKGTSNDLGFVLRQIQACCVDPMTVWFTSTDLEANAWQICKGNLASMENINIERLLSSWPSCIVFQEERKGDERGGRGGGGGGGGESCRNQRRRTYKRVYNVSCIGFFP